MKATGNATVTDYETDALDNRQEGAIHEIQSKLMSSHTDPDQGGDASLSNDLLLMEISRMVLDFLHNSRRKVISYSNHPEDWNEDSGGN